MVVKSTDETMAVIESDTDVLHDLKHYQQKYNWDCGLSCVLMILPEQSRNYIINNFYKVVEEEGFGESTWTIDLCYLLHRFNITFSYLTITIGIDPGYSKEDFYDKVLSKDNERVNQRFDRAQELGMKISKKSVDSSHIVDKLKNGPVIVLINANQLVCLSCSDSSYTCYTSCLRLFSDSYQGHYITVVGYNSDKSEILYRNPTLKNKICNIPVGRFEECRTAYGTDEDIIFVDYKKL